MDEIEELISERQRAVERVLAKTLSGEKLDCRRGCFYCCYGVTLWGTKLEVLHLVRELNRLDLKTRKAVSLRIKRYLKLYYEAYSHLGTDNPYGPAGREDLSAEVMGKIGTIYLNEEPCPFLEEKKGECRVYEARPLMCRLTVFTDSRVCKKDWENPLSGIWFREIRPFVDGVREKFFSSWKIEALRLGIKEDEDALYFIPAFIYFDPVRKRFRFREKVPRSP